MGQRERAIVAGGCFWCTEATLQKLKGVIEIVPGYAASKVENPSYEAVCTGKTGATEAIEITFDPEILPYEKLLEIFWHIHDPTSLNRQGNDVGTQYRSGIYYLTEEQRKTALASKEALEKSGSYKKPIVTEIEAFSNFYPAEDYHKNYYEQNRFQPYCMFVIDPKIKKLLKEYQKEVQR